MNYRVLYRKYRPDSFSNLVGQDNIIKILQNSIITNKMSHAYIFSGPRGTGKTSTAKILAKNMNCLDPINGCSCNKCINCLSYENSSDIIEIDAASNNGVNEMREIINNINLVPGSMKYKIYIIDEVHMLSQSAFNALLLTLEEPPDHVKFILATTNIENVPITILSRCQRFDFCKISIDDIYNRLRYISDIENINITDDAIKLIAKLSDGGLRDSLSLLDQISKENTDITLDTISKYSGNITDVIISQLFNYIDESDLINYNILINSLSDRNTDFKLLIKRFITLLSNVVCDILSGKINTRLNVDEIKKLTFDLVNFQNSFSISLDCVSVFNIIIYSYFGEVKLINNNEKHIGEATDIKKEENIPVINHDVDDNVPLEKTSDELNTLIESEEEVDSDYLLKISDIYVNNCFVSASKDEKAFIISKWATFIDDIGINLKGILIDTEIAMASKDIIVLTVQRDNDLYKINKFINNIVCKFSDFMKMEKKLTFITTEKWNYYVEKFKKDRINGIIYVLKDENISDDLSDIFDINKIEER